MAFHKVQKSDLYNRLRKELADMVICDNHEHLSSEEDWINKDFADWSLILGYAVTDLYNAGLDKDDFPIPLVRGPLCRATFGYDITPKVHSNWEKKWEIVKPYWKYVRHNGSGIIARKCLEMFFGCEDLTDETVPIVQEKYKEFLRPGAYKELLIDKGKFNHVITVVGSLDECPATEVLAPILYLDQYCDLENRGDLYRVENQAGMEVYSLKSYLQAVDTVLERFKNAGCIGMKWHRLAYLRDNKFDHASYADAEADLVKILLKPTRGGWGSASSPGLENMTDFQNFMVHYLIQKCIDYDWGTQIHAAQLGASYGGRTLQSEVKNLQDIFTRYPQARFDMLHGSWPFTRQLHAFAHMFPNVSINTSWLELLSPTFYKAYIKELLTSIPLTKVNGCGPDQFDPILSAPYAELTRDLWAEVLEELVAEGYLTEEDGLFAAKQILLVNPTEFYRLDDRIIPNK